MPRDTNTAVDEMSGEFPHYFSFTDFPQLTDALLTEDPNVIDHILEQLENRDKELAPTLEQIDAAEKAMESSKAFELQQGVISDEATDPRSVMDFIKDYLKKRSDAMKKIHALENKAAQNNGLVQLPASDNPDVLPVNGKQQQSTKNGCWSVSMGLLLQSAGINLNQKEIRAYRPKLTPEEKEEIIHAANTNNDDNKLSIMTQDVKGNIPDYADLIVNTVPNTAVRTITYRYTADQREQVKKDFADRIQEAIVNQKSPVSFTDGTHYRTVIGINRNTNKYYVADSLEKNSPLEMDLDELIPKDNGNVEITWIHHLTYDQDGKMTNIPSSFEGISYVHGRLDQGAGYTNSSSSLQKDSVSLSLQLSDQDDMQNPWRTERIAVPKKLVLPQDIRDKQESYGKQVPQDYKSAAVNKLQTVGDLYMRTSGGSIIRKLQKFEADNRNALQMGAKNAPDSPEAALADLLKHYDKRVSDKGMVEEERTGYYIELDQKLSALFNAIGKQPQNRQNLWNKMDPEIKEYAQEYHEAIQSLMKLNIAVNRQDPQLNLSALTEADVQDAIGNYILPTEQKYNENVRKYAAEKAMENAGSKLKEKASGAFGTADHGIYQKLQDLAGFVIDPHAAYDADSAHAALKKVLMKYERKDTIARDESYYKGIKEDFEDLKEKAKAEAKEPDALADVWTQLLITLRTWLYQYNAVYENWDKSRKNLEQKLYRTSAKAQPLSASTAGTVNTKKTRKSSAGNQQIAPAYSTKKTAEHDDDFRLFPDEDENPSQGNINVQKPFSASSAMAPKPTAKKTGELPANTKPAPSTKVNVSSGGKLSADKVSNAMKDEYFRKARREMMIFRNQMDVLLSEDFTMSDEFQRLRDAVCAAAGDYPTDSASQVKKMRTLEGAARDYIRTKDHDMYAKTYKYFHGHEAGEDRATKSGQHRYIYAKRVIAYCERQINIFENTLGSKYTAHYVNVASAQIYMMAADAETRAADLRHKEIKDTQKLGEYIALKKMIDEGHSASIPNLTMQDLEDEGTRIASTSAMNLLVQSAKGKDLRMRDMYTGYLAAEKYCSDAGKAEKWTDEAKGNYRRRLNAKPMYRSKSHSLDIAMQEIMVQTYDENVKVQKNNVSKDKQPGAQSEKTKNFTFVK